jgi:hypothetical protein
MGELGELPKPVGMTRKFLTHSWVSLGELGGGFADIARHDKGITHPGADGV